MGPSSSSALLSIAASPGAPRPSHPTGRVRCHEGASDGGAGVRPSPA